MSAIATLPAPQTSPLDELETDCLTYLADGCMLTEIAQFIQRDAEYTLQTLHRIVRKLGARNQRHAIAIGLRHNLID